MDYFGLGNEVASQLPIHQLAGLPATCPLQHPALLYNRNAHHICICTCISFDYFTCSSSSSSNGRAGEEEARFVISKWFDVALDLIIIMLYILYIYVCSIKGAQWNSCRRNMPGECAAPLIKFLWVFGATNAISFALMAAAAIAAAAAAVQLPVRFAGSNNAKYTAQQKRRKNTERKSAGKKHSDC